MVNIAGSLNCLYQFIQRKFVGNDGFQIPFSTGHYVLYIPYILRHITTSSNDALLRISHMQQINGSGCIINRNRNKPALNFSKALKVIKDRFYTSSIQPAVNVGRFFEQ